MSWEKVKLTSLCRPRQWKTLSMNKLQLEGFPVYGANGKIGFYSTYTHEKPTLAIACRGTCGNVHITDPMSYINGNAMALDNLSNKIDIKFLFYYMQFRGFQDVISGSSQPQITGEGLSKVEIPLPPLDIQKRIADILDAADALRQKDQELLKKYEELTQAIFMDMFGDPVKNEKGWRKYLFSELLLKIESGWSPICLETKASEDEWGVLKLGSITKCRYNENENKALPPSETAKKNLEVKTGDLLFSRKNTHELVAATAYVHKTRPNLMMSDLIFRLVIKDKKQISPIYLQKLLINPSKRSQVQKLANGAAGSMPNISKEKLLNLEIEVPPISLQKQFESYLENIESSKTNAQESIYKSVSLFNSLLQKAFTGELVN